MHADSLSTVPDLITAFGGPTAFSKVIEKGASTAGEMKRSGRIHDEYWDAIIAAAPSVDIEGLEYRHFVQMHANARASASQPQSAEAGQ